MTDMTLLEVLHNLMLLAAAASIFYLVIWKRA